MDWNKLKAEIVAALTVVFLVLNTKLGWGIDGNGIAAIVGLMGSLIVMYAMSHNAQVKAVAQVASSTPTPEDGNAGTNVSKLLMIAILLGIVLGGCSGLASKTAKDIDNASSMILPEYLIYVDADPKLDTDGKRQRHDQVQALQDVVRNAQK